MDESEDAADATAGDQADTGQDTVQEEGEESTDVGTVTQER